MDLDIVNKTVSIVAKRGSGKSVLAKYLIEQSKARFEKIFLFCPTEKVNNHYSKGGFVPEQNIHDEWNEQFVLDLIEKLSKVNANKKKSELKNVLLILDDIFSDTNFATSKALKLVMTRGRHIGISVFCLQQYLNCIPPIMRNNMDWCLFGMVNQQSKDIMAEQYLAGSLDKKAFFDLYGRATKDYGFLVINNNAIADNEDLNSIYGIIRTPEEYIE